MRACQWERRAAPVRGESTSPKGAFGALTAARRGLAASTTIALDAGPDGLLYGGSTRVQSRPPRFGPTGVGGHRPGVTHRWRSTREGIRREGRGSQHHHGAVITGHDKGTCGNADEKKGDTDGTGRTYPNARASSEKSLWRYLPSSVVGNRMRSDQTASATAASVMTEAVGNLGQSAHRR